MDRVQRFELVAMLRSCADSLEKSHDDEQQTRFVLDALLGTLADVERTEAPAPCACGSGLDARACQRTWRHCKLCTSTAAPESEFCERHASGQPVAEDYKR